MDRMLFLMRGVSVTNAARATTLAPTAAAALVAAAATTRPCANAAPLLSAKHSERQAHSTGVASVCSHGLTEGERAWAHAAGLTPAAAAKRLAAAPAIRALLPSPGAPGAGAAGRLAENVAALRCASIGKPPPELRAALAALPPRLLEQLLLAAPRQPGTQRLARSTQLAARLRLLLAQVASRRAAPATQVLTLLRHRQQQLLGQQQQPFRPAQRPAYQRPRGSGALKQDGLPKPRTLHLAALANALAQALGDSSDLEQSLAEALARAAHEPALRRRQPCTEAVAADFGRALLDLGMHAEEVMLLLCQHPTLLWQVDPSKLPLAGLQHLCMQLPSLLLFTKKEAPAGRRPAKSVHGLAGLLQREPGVLFSCTRAQVSDLLALLCDSLRLGPEVAANVLLAQPRMLLVPVQQLRMAMGFLMGIGLSTEQLTSMAASNPAWMLRSIKELTAQWRFLSTSGTVELADIVLFPELLSLPIDSCLGPRLAYARKRHVKLLTPSYAMVLPSLTEQDWLAHQLVPLKLWLRDSDEAMCRATGMDAVGYSRFKAAWMRVAAVATAQRPVL